MANKYEGPTSAYAKNEGVWVPKLPRHGVNFITGVSIASLIIRDFLRGYTYDGKGHKIKMDEHLFRRRLFYLVTLCHKHTRRKRICEKLHEVVTYAYHRVRLPPWVTVYLAGPNAEKVAEELKRKNIASNIVIVDETGKIRYYTRRMHRRPMKKVVIKKVYVVRY